MCEKQMMQSIARAFAQGNYEQVLCQAQALKKQNPQSGFAYNALAVGYLYLNQEKKAWHFAQQALFLEPENAQFLSNAGLILARAFKNQKSLEKARDLLLKSRQIQPNCAATLENLSFVFYYLQDYERAADFAHQAIAQNPQSAQAYMNGSAACRMQHFSYQAYCLGKKALDLAPLQPQFLNDVAVCAKDIGLVQEAKMLNEQALALAPDDYKNALMQLVLASYAADPIALIRQKAQYVHQVFAKRLAGSPPERACFKTNWFCLR